MRDEALSCVGPADDTRSSHINVIEAERVNDFGTPDVMNLVSNRV